MKQKVISTMLLLSMGATLLAGCGTTAGNGTEGGASNAAEGKVINIYSCMIRGLHLSFHQ